MVFEREPQDDWNADCVSRNLACCCALFGQRQANAMMVYISRLSGQLSALVYRINGGRTRW